MSYFDVANSPLLYVLVAGGILYIIGLSAVFLIKAWYRLSVVGSVSYELMAADMVADGMGYGSVGEMAAQADYSVFGAVMFVMSICILAGILVNLFAVENPAHFQAPPAKEMGLPSFL